MNNYLSIITLNVNGLNAPIKRHRIAGWIRKHDPHICCLQETHLRTKDLHRPKVNGWKQIFIILKGRIHQEDINIVNIYAPNIRAPKYIKKILEDFKKDIDSNTIIVGNFKIPLSKMDRCSKQNIKKDIVSLNNTLDEMDLTDI